MRYSLLLLILITSINGIAQTIDYTLPDNFRGEITQSDYHRLVDSSVRIVGQRYKVDHVKDGTITLKEKQELAALNLDNLVLKCKEARDKAEFDAIVRKHFENLFTSIDDNKKLDPMDYETIKTHLTIRIYTKESVEQRASINSIVTRTDLEGTYSVLMLDLPTAFSVVTRTAFDHWGKDINAVFREALNNIDQQEIEKVTRKFATDRDSIELSFIGNENYAASYALDLANNSPELVGEWGSAVAIPNKGLVDICKISRDKPVDFIKFIQISRAEIQRAYSQHPQPISNDFFWYYKGKFTRILVTTAADGSVSVVAPMGLAELMSVKK